MGVSKLPFPITIGAMLKIAEVACTSDSYEDAQTRLKEFGIVLNDDTVRAVTNTIGEIVFRNEMRVADEAEAAFQTCKYTFPNTKMPYILYLEVDGAMVPTRRTKEQNILDKRHKESKTASSDEQDFEDADKNYVWRENKLGLAFSTDNFHNWTDIHGEQQHKILKRDYTAFIGEASEFSKLVFAMAIRNGYGVYQDTVIISDGATWIREMKNKYFCDAQQILDYWHLCENVSEFAKSVFGTDKSKIKLWTNDICDLLKKSRTNEAIHKIKKIGKAKLSMASSNIVQYIENNIDNVDYAAYIAKGYSIGSGAIESSNKTVVQRRLKLPGMRWNVKSAQYVITLMTKIKSNRWEQDVVKPIYKKYGLSPGKVFNFRRNAEEVCT
jgi:hypothetical protein